LKIISEFKPRRPDDDFGILVRSLPIEKSIVYYHPFTRWEKKAIAVSGLLGFSLAMFAIALKT